MLVQPGGKYAPDHRSRRFIAVCYLPHASIRPVDRSYGAAPSATGRARGPSCASTSPSYAATGSPQAAQLELQRQQLQLESQRLQQQIEMQHQQIALQQKQLSGSASVSADSSPAQTSSMRRVQLPKGVVLNSEMEIGDGWKLCKFSNGFERRIATMSSCWVE
jgi:hypothetical protein